MGDAAVISGISLSLAPLLSGRCSLPRSPQMGFEGIDTIVYLTVLKQVSAAEYNPIEFINVSVIDGENVV
jgi:hypothetical protein